MEHRRRKSKDALIIESAFSLAAVLIFLWLFAPGFRPGLQLLFAFVVLASLVWLVYEFIKPGEDSPTFKTFTFDPHPSTAPVSQAPPAVSVEGVGKARKIPKLNFSESLRKIDWFQFEKLIELVYQHRGFKVKRLGGANPDGGIDLIVSSHTEQFAIQCKHWRKSTVGVKEIREFLGALTDSKIPGGIYITLVGYSGEAKQLADKHEIQILRELDLVKMLEDCAHGCSEDISKLLSDERRFCPKCESEMVLKKNRQTGDKFWGCSTFPKCWYKLPFED